MARTGSKFPSFKLADDRQTGWNDLQIILGITTVWILKTTDSLARMTCNPRNCYNEMPFQEWVVWEVNIICKRNLTNVQGEKHAIRSILKSQAYCRTQMSMKCM